jgi:hypothetical protein
MVATVPSCPPSSTAPTPEVGLTLDVLRAKLDAAILAEAWDAVKAIGERIREVERAGVLDLDAARRRRGG